MHFANFQTFLHMGGYARYVWSAYGITTLVCLAQLILALRSHSHASCP